MQKQTKTTLALVLTGCVLGALAALLPPDEFLFPSAEREGREAAEKGLVYVCPMLCTRSDKPGTCPVCGMELEPREIGDLVNLDPRAQSMIGLTLTQVTPRKLSRVIDTTSVFSYDERSYRTITAWFDGRIDDLALDFEGASVSASGKLANLYSPTIFTAEQEYLLALARSEGSLAESSRRRLELLGVSSEEIARLRDSGAPSTHVAITSPIGGTVIKKYVREGDYVKTGQKLFDVADLTKLWLEIDVYETDFTLIDVGLVADIRANGYPEGTFTGVIEFIDPVLNERTRTARARITVENDGALLRPGMFADARIRIPINSRGRAFSGRAEDAPEVLAVPRGSVLSLGSRNVVYKVVSSERDLDAIAMKQISFAMATVSIGALSVDENGDEYYPLAGGLMEDEVIAMDGAFLIDSESELQGLPSLMKPEGGQSGGEHQH
ncbi:MAG: efflux RND transporter periplasmic adaptor subunit [Planctomycetes bacterium]|nr:efflux RND transporter periplasmic adaptor subunit [Planctomycetota bacterium]